MCAAALALEPWLLALRRRNIVGLPAIGARQD